MYDLMISGKITHTDSEINHKTLAKRTTCVLVLVFNN